MVGLSLPKFVPYLRPWGEAGVVHVKTLSTGKLDDRGEKMLYVGASMHHSGDTYLMFSPHTSRIHKTRDVVFTNKMYYRQDGSPSSDQKHPLDTSFFDMHLISDTPPVPAPPPPIATDDDDTADTSMPSLVPRDDISLPTLSTVDSDHKNDDLWGSLPSSVQFADPHAQSPPASAPDDGWQGPDISDPVDELEMPDLPIIDATNVRPGEAIDSEINAIPTEINIVGGSSESYAVLSDSSGGRSPQEEAFHTVTRRGRHVRKPSRYREPETEAITIANNYYSVFDIEDPMESPSDTESDSLFDLHTPLNIE